MEPLLIQTPWDIIVLFAFTATSLGMITNTILYSLLTFWRKIFQKTGETAYMFVLINFWVIAAAAIVSYHETLLSYKVSVPDIIQWLGLILLTFGGGLEVWSSAKLGLKGIFEIPAVFDYRTPEHMASSGPYALMRHPMYFGDMLMLAGVFLKTGFISLLFLLIVYCAYMRQQTRLEEKEMRERYGEEYEKYMTKTQLSHKHKKLSNKTNLL